MMFNLIRSNYHSEDKIDVKNPLISTKINTLLDKSRYPVIKANAVPITTKRIVLISIIVILSVFATANAKTIYKTYKELVNSMFVDKALFNITEIQHTGIYSDEDYVKSIYDKYQDAVKLHIAEMETAEISKLKYDVDGKTFRVQIAKGIKGNFISYGFEGYTIFHNDFSDSYSMSFAKSIFTNNKKYNSIDELLSAPRICHIPEYIPHGYNFKNSHLTYINQSQNIPDNLGLLYEKGKGEFLYITLTRSKMAVDNVGMPNELVEAAGLYFTERDDIESIDTPADVKETLDIGEYQAVYVEENIKNSIKNEDYSISKSINMFLGDSAKLPILRIHSAFWGKMS